MNVVSTRGTEPVALSTAIAKGQAPDGGLYMPQTITKQGRPIGTLLTERTTHALQPFFAGDTMAPHLDDIREEQAQTPSEISEVKSNSSVTSTKNSQNSLETSPSHRIQTQTRV